MFLRFASVSVAALLLCSSWAIAQDSQPVSVPSKITGVVLLPDGKPAANARVVMARANELLSKTQTNAAGEFRLDFDRQEILNAGQMMLRAIDVAAHVDGTGFGFVAFTDIKADQPVTIQLVEDVPITGRILDQQGRPVDDVNVRVVFLAQPIPGKNMDEFLKRNRDSPTALFGRMTVRTCVSPFGLVPLTGGESSDGLLSAATDAAGKFTIQGLGRERLATIEMSHPELASTKMHIVTRPEIEDRWKRGPLSRDTKAQLSAGIPLPVVYGANFRHIASPGLSIPGTVTAAETGEPIEGVGFIASMGWQSFSRAKSDAKGQFSVSGLKLEGQLNLTIRAPGPWLHARKSGRIKADDPPEKTDDQIGSRCHRQGSNHRRPGDSCQWPHPILWSAIEPRAKKNSRIDSTLSTLAK